MGYLIYGLAFSILSGLFTLMFRQAQATMDPEDAVRRKAAREWARAWAPAAVTGVLSGLVAVTPALRAAPWLPGAIYWRIPISITVLGAMDR